MRRLIGQQVTMTAVVTAVLAVAFAGTAIHASAIRIAPPGGPSVTMTPSGSEDVFYRGDQNHLFEQWYTGGHWYGVADVTAGFNYQPPLESAPSAAATPDGSTVVVFWRGSGGALIEAWQVGNTWHGPVDIGNAYLNMPVGLASAPSVAIAPDGTQLVFWQGTDDRLYEASYSGGTWHGEVNPVEQGAPFLLRSAPSVTVAPNGTEAVFWQVKATNHLMEIWHVPSHAGWYGPSDKTSYDFGGRGGLLASSPAAATTPDGSTQLVFWQDSAGHLNEAWYAAGSWHGPVDWTATAFGGNQLLTSAPAVAVTTDSSTQVVLWRNALGEGCEAWFAGKWYGPELAVY